MQDWLEARADASPDKIAIIEHSTPTQTNEISYTNLNMRVNSMCRQMLNAGIDPGQHVAMLMMNSTLAIVPFFAAMRLGLIFVPLNSRLTPEEIDLQLKQSDTDWLLSYGYTDIVLALRDKGHKVANLADEVKYKAPLPKREINLADPFLIVHTSGTSGTPKGAMLTYGNLFYSAMASAYRIGHNTSDKWLCILPLFHVGGLSIFIRAVLYGITVELYEKFDTKQINHALRDDNITLISLVPTMLYRLLKERSNSWNESLRLILLGGAAATPELMRTCIEQEIPVATTYGLSEAASQVATTLPGDAVLKPGTVGKALLFTQIKIIDETGVEQPPNGYGEVMVKGLTVMHGYYNNPSATAQTIVDGWLHTGDIGYLDDDGDLFLVQRRSDLIITGGENVYPAEIEAVLRQHPAIESVAIVGIDDAEWGQQVAAAIVVARGETITDSDVEQLCRQHLAGYKIPRIVRFVDDLPLTGSGKVQRNAVRDLFATNEDIP